MFVVEYVKDMKWETPTHDYFSCTVKYAQFKEELSACIFPNDVEEHTLLIPIQEYVEPEPPPVENAAPNQQPSVEGAQTL